LGGVVGNALGAGDVMELNFLGSRVAIDASVVLIVAGENVACCAAPQPRLLAAGCTPLVASGGSWQPG
jgi:hypothetical protein